MATFQTYQQMQSILICKTINKTKEKKLEKLLLFFLIGLSLSNKICYNKTSEVSMKKINVYNDNSDERKYEIKKLINMFSSSHINVLLGSGFSMPLLRTLANIEKDLTKAIKDNDIEKQANLYKTFFEGSMLPLINKKDEKHNINARNNFVKHIYNFADTRDSSTLHKMINIYTTNYDNLIESSLETNKIPYF